MLDGTEGYVDAQVRLRAKFGKDCTFFSPTPTTWPPGTPLNLNGDPLDPSVTPLASGVASASVRCSVVSRPILRTLEAPPMINAPVGLKDHANLVVIMSRQEFEDNELENATTVEIFDQLYKIVAAINDNTAGGDEPYQRKLLFVEKL